MSKKGYKQTEEHIENANKDKRGRKLSGFHILKLKEARKKYFDRGNKPWNWIEDRTKLCRMNKQGERRTSAYFEWRKQVWLRDNFKCKIVNKDCDGRIEAHHILSWKDYPELRYVINNGITLCHYHHPRKRVDEIKLIQTFTGLVMQKN